MRTSNVQLRTPNVEQKCDRKHSTSNVQRSTTNEIKNQKSKIENPERRPSKILPRRKAETPKFTNADSERRQSSQIENGKQQGPEGSAPSESPPPEIKNAERTSPLSSFGGEGRGEEVFRACSGNQESKIRNRKCTASRTLSLLPHRSSCAAARWRKALCQLPKLRNYPALAPQSSSVLPSVR